LVEITNTTATEEAKTTIEADESSQLNSRLDVIGTRIRNELKVLTGVFDHSYISQTRTLHVYLKNVHYNLTLELGPKTQFPFMPPLFKFQAKANEDTMISLFDLKRATFEDLMLEHWHPSIKIVDIAERAEEFIRKNVTRVTDVPGKLIKIVNGKSVTEIVKKIVLVKLVIGLVMMILTKDHESEFVKDLRWVATQTTESAYHPKAGEIGTYLLPLHFHLLQGLSLLCPEPYLPLAASTLSLLGDLVLLTPALVLLSLSSHLHLHVSLRLSLLSLTALSLPLSLPLPTTLSLSLCLYSVYLLLHGDSYELATVLFTGAMSMSQWMIWVMPAVAAVMMRKMLGG